MRRLSRFPIADRGMHPRLGVSLIEVLVSMIIMSVGIMGLATLLPISILRTAQATQLTQSVFLKNNAQALLESNPNLLNNTQIPTAGTSLTIGANNYFNVTDGVTYAAIDPLGYYTTNTATPAVLWTSTQANPLLLPSTIYPYVPRLNLGLTNRGYAANYAALPDSWTTVAEDVVTYASGSPPTLTMATSTTVPTLNLYNSYSVVNNQDYAHYRLVMFDVTGNNVVIKPLYQASGQVLSWWDVNSSNNSLSYGTALPANYTPVRARIEVMERRFTWMMTVKKEVLDSVDSTWSCDVDVAVFFNRAFNTNDEYGYSVILVPPLIGGAVNATFVGGFDSAYGVRGVDDDNNGTVDDATEIGWTGSDDNRTATVSWTPAPAGTDPLPYLKKGGFMLEPNNLEWYRILDLVITPPVSPSTQYQAVLLLDKDVRYDPSVTVPGAIVAGQINLAGIFMRGVVDIYPLGTINGQQ